MPAAQRLSEQQAAAGGEHRHPLALEALDRVPVEDVGLVALADQRLGEGEDRRSAQLVPDGPRHARQVLDRLLGERTLAGARGRLHQLEQARAA